MVKSAQDGVRTYEAGSLNRAEKPAHLCLETDAFFRIQLTPVRFDVLARAFERPSPIAEAGTTAVVIGHHRIEPIHI
jgi:hypothetical protein